MTSLKVLKPDRCWKATTSECNFGGSDTVMRLSALGVSVRFVTLRLTLNKIHRYNPRLRKRKLSCHGNVSDDA